VPKGRGHQLLLIASFLVVIYTVGVVQAVIELRGGDPVQFLDLFRRMPNVENLRSFENDLETGSWFAKTLRPRMQYVRFVAFRDAGEKALVGRNGWWFYRPGVRYLIEPVRNDPVGKTGHDQAVAAIVSFRDRLAARGIHLLVVPIPGKASVYPDMLTGRVARGDRSVHDHTRRIVRDLADAGVEVADPFAAFMRAREGASVPRSQQDETHVYMARDTHWMRQGVRAAAAEAARRILELGWVRAGSVKFGTRSVRVKRHGDIVRMLRTPRIERLFPPEDVVCEQVVRQDTGEPYRDDPNAAILVLGDSFLRIYERDEPGSAGFIAHLARELGQPVASIVNDGGASTLVRQELARKPELLVGKTLVVWEFVERDIRFGWGGWQDVPLPEMVLSAPAGSSSRPAP